MAKIRTNRTTTQATGVTSKTMLNGLGFSTKIDVVLSLYSTLEFDIIESGFSFIKSNDF